MENLSGKTKKELETIAKDLELKFTSKSTKAELIELISAQQTNKGAKAVKNKKAEVITEIKKDVVTEVIADIKPVTKPEVKAIVEVSQPIKSEKPENTVILPKAEVAKTESVKVDKPAKEEMKFNNEVKLENNSSKKTKNSDIYSFSEGCSEKYSYSVL